MNHSKKIQGYSDTRILVQHGLSICLRYPMILYDVMSKSHGLIQ